jgi:peroxiredoxin (alkyl hydroperoxide reductase subunit C)
MTKEAAVAVDVGQEAPEFELSDSEGGKTKLSDYRGKKNVLLVFYPLAFSPICNTEFCAFRDVNADIQSDDTEVLGISVDSPWTLRAWKDHEKFPNKFVADFWPHGQVARDYGAFLEKRGISIRSTFLIDKQGVVRWKEENQPLEARDQAGWRKALAELSG